MAEVKTEVKVEAEAPAAETAEVTATGDAMATEIKTELKSEVKKEANGAGGDQKANGSNGSSVAELSDEEKAKRTEAIVTQVEYYFGDHNLPKDRFLQEQIKLDEGWVSMETMLKFARLKKLSPDPQVIMAALKENSKMMEVDEEGQRIRRNPDLELKEFNDEVKKETMRNTVYLKGFNKEDTTLDELLNHFKGDSVVSVHLRTFVNKKDNKKGFKGSVFITFKNREAAEAFMAKDKVEYKGVELIKKWQEDYFEEKKQEFEESRKEKLDKKKNLKAAKEAAEEAKEKAEEAAREEASLPKGSVLYLTNLNGETQREDIKEVLNEKFDTNPDDIAFIYYQKGESEAKLRFKVENAAKEVMEKIGEAAVLEIKGSEAKVAVLEGEEEATFLASCLDDIKKWRRNSSGRGHKRRGGGRGGRGGYGKRQKMG
jgi:lupus La protein